MDSDTEVKLKEVEASIYTVELNLKQLHPMVVGTLKTLKTQKADEYGRLYSRRGENILSVRASNESLERVCALLDALIKAMTALGFPLDMKQGVPDWDSETAFLVFGERLGFHIEEPSKRTDHVLKLGEKRTSYTERWDYHPSGNLVLMIDTYVGEGYQQRWVDRPGKPLEVRFKDIVEGFVCAGQGARRKRQQREAEEIEARKREALRIETKERERVEGEAVSKLMKQVEGWEVSRRVDAYLDAFEADYRVKRGAIEEGSDVQNWLVWARGLARRSSPLKR